MSDKLIRESLDEYAALNTPPGADLWPRLASNLHAAQGQLHSEIHGWLPGEEKELSWLSVTRSARNDRRREGSGRQAFLATTVTGLATLLLAILGTLGLLSFTSSAPNAGTGRSGSLSVVAVPSKSDPTTTPTTSPAEDKATVPDPHMLPPGDFITKSPDLEYVERLGTKLDISQTVSGYTVTLQRAYADANQIVVVYTVAGPDSNITGVVGNTLVDRDSPAVFAPMFGYADPADAQPGTYAYVFDASALDKLPSELHLSLSFELGKGKGIGSDLPATPSVKDETNFNEIIGSRLFSDTGQLTPEDLLQPFGLEIIAGPFQFDFAVPVSTSGTSVVPVGQTVDAAGMKITLDKLVVTPGEARLTFSFEAPAGDSTPWQPVLTVEAGDYNSDDKPGDLRIETDSSVGKGSWTYSLIAPLTGKQGEWTVTISELRAGHGIDLKDGGPADFSDPTQNDTRTLAGSWVFKFTVPPAQP
ncbi:MAG TPA: DUF4179 domain-containing protein [Chloroflexia bacterium]|jgi:hypothetical protein